MGANDGKKRFTLISIESICISIASEIIHHMEP